MLALLGACAGERSLPRDMQTADGLTIYLGVVPAALMQVEIPAHGGAPPPRESHHVVVALFDAATRARVSDARITAAVMRDPADAAPGRPLEPMTVNGLVTFGNFVSMPGPGLWIIRLVIVRPGGGGPVTADFAYEYVAGH